MAAPIACVAPTRRLARAAAAAARLARARLEPFTLRAYLVAPNRPARIVLCPAGRSLADDLRFLNRTARRLLWPPPPAVFRDAIGAIRAREVDPRPVAAGTSAAPAAAGIAAALLLEGPVGLGRARAALASSAPRDWIVETAGHVRIGNRSLSALARAGVRWWALAPIEVVGLYASPALAKAHAKWEGLLPKGTRVWIRK